MSSPLNKPANVFAVSLFQNYLRRHGDKYRNLLLCPYLIYHSLAMMLVGAKGATAKQLIDLLRLPNELINSDGSVSSSSSSSSPNSSHRRNSPVSDITQGTNSPSSRGSSAGLAGAAATTTTTTTTTSVALAVGAGTVNTPRPRSSSVSSISSVSSLGSLARPTGCGRAVTPTRSPVASSSPTLTGHPNKKPLGLKPCNCSAGSRGAGATSGGGGWVANNGRRSRSTTRRNSTNCLNNQVGEFGSTKSSSLDRKKKTKKKTTTKQRQSARVAELASGANDGKPPVAQLVTTVPPTTTTASSTDWRSHLAPGERSLGKSLRSKRGKPEDLRHREFLMLTEQLLHGNHEFIHVASFIYLDKDVKRSASYKETLRDYYETKPKKIDFGDADSVVKTINDDVARTTENIYSDILSKQEAQKLEKSMLLVNAVFFRGFWLSNFTDVRESIFHKSKQEFKVQMMSKLDYLPVVRDQQLDARIIMMQFEASDLQMLLILPNNKDSDSTYLCDQITAAKIDHIVEEISNAKCRTIKVSMPVFCIDSGKISIQSTLVQMGAGDLFDQKKANMSGVCDNKSIWLNKILHRCFIICDNRGAITSSGFEKAKKRQAKLVSGVAQGRSGVEEFSTDHPFMYIIVDSVTSTILMMGLYTDPSETLEVLHESQLDQEEAHKLMAEGVYKT